MNNKARYIAITMTILGSYWAYLLLPGITDLLSFTIITPGYFIYAFWIYRIFNKSDGAIFFYLWLFSACWHSVFIFGFVFTYMLLEGIIVTIITIYGFIGCILSLVGAMMDFNKEMGEPGRPYNSD